MGWFWADSPTPIIKHPHHGMDMTGKPPSACPMHNKSDNTADVASHFKQQQQQQQPAPPSACPVNHSESSSSSSSWSSKLNPLNMMPALSQSRAPNQKTTLSTTRSISTIPKGDNDNEGNWVYPSPQQMYNALLRKGYKDTPEDAIDSMVDVHNFLNEGAWLEIVEWERQFKGGVIRGWKIAAAGGNEDAVEDVYDEKALKQRSTPPRLLRFMGRPSEPTPKARILNMLGYVYPSKFGGPLPFDRHDWYVQRQAAYDPNTEEPPAPTEHRYVIDYYSGPPEPTGEPVFFLDVRPALDNPKACMERFARWSGSTWYKASGAVVRDELRRKDEEDRRLGRV